MSFQLNFTRQAPLNTFKFYDNLIVGIFSGSSSPECRQSVSACLRCDSVDVKATIFWLRLLSIVTNSITVKVLNDSQALQNSFKENLIDITENVIPLRLDEHPNSHTTTPLRTSQFVFYASRRGITEHSQLSNDFLIAPFSKLLWLATGGIAVSMLLIQCLALRSQQRLAAHPVVVHLLIRHHFVVLLIGIICSPLSTFYSSQLKAQLYTKTANVPFEDLYDLARQIEVGTKQIVIEKEYTTRYGMLTGREFDRTMYEPLQAVYCAIRKSGSGVRVVNDPSELCKLVDSSMKYVYFGQDEMIQSYKTCARACFWRYELTEVPTMPLSWLVSNRTRLGRQADVLVHALENYKRLTLERTYVWKCDEQKSAKANLIGQKQLFLAYSLLGMGLMASSTVLMVERRLR